MTKDEALKLALPIVERERFIQEASYGQNYNADRSEKARKAHEAIKEALAQPDHGAVANVVLREGLPTLLSNSQIKPTDERLYTSPPHRKPLTEERLHEIFDRVDQKRSIRDEQHTLRMFIVREVEAAHDIKESV